MKQRDLLMAGLILFSPCVFAQEDEAPQRYSDDAVEIFKQDFEGSASWQKIQLNMDPKRPTTLYTWQAEPIDSIKQVTYYKRLQDSNPGGGTDIYTNKEYLVAGVRDTTMYLYNGIMRTDAVQPDDSILNYDLHDIALHDASTQSGSGIGGAEYGLDRFGESGDNQYFKYISANGNGVAGYSSDNHAVPEYRRNLFVRLDPGKIQENSSYRVTVFVKAKSTASTTSISPRIGLDLMRGYFHSEKPFMVNRTGRKSNNNTSYDSFADKTDYVINTGSEENKWQKITLMAYYTNDSVGDASPYLLGYYWKDDWAWNTVVGKDTVVLPEGVEGDTVKLGFIKQPNKYFVRLSFRSDSTEFMVDNLSLTKSWIGGVEHYGDMLRVDFGYQTNLGDLAQKAKDENKIAAVELPGEYFDVWTLWGDAWERMPILSAEYHGDGYMYMWTEPYEDGDLRSFEGADSVLVSFRNPTDRDDLKLLYTGNQFPNGTDKEWIDDAKKRLVFDFHNEISALNPTIVTSPLDHKSVKSLKNLPPVLQKQMFSDGSTIEDGTFGLDPQTDEFRFKFSRNVAFDDKEDDSNLTIATLSKAGYQEFLEIQPYGDVTDGTTIIKRKSTTPLSGDYVLTIDQLTHLKNADPTDTEAYGEDVVINLHFGEFSKDPQVITFAETDWNIAENATEAHCLGTAVVDDANKTYAVGEGLKGSGSRLYRYSEAGQMDCAYYLCPRANNIDAHLWIGVGDDEKYNISLEAGDYKVSFYAIGWDGKAETKLYVYSYTEKPADLKTSDKTLIGTFTPTQQISSGDGKKTDFVITTADALSYQFNIPTTGKYIFEFEVPKAAHWTGSLISDIHITNTGALADGPVINLNKAISTAENWLAGEDKYKGVVMDALQAVKNVADGFIDSQIAIKKNLPSAYAKMTKALNDASNAQKNRVDTVNNFDKKLADAQNKIDLFETADSLKAYKDLAAIANLASLTSELSSGYPYARKSGDEIVKDMNSVDAAINDVDSRVALNQSYDYFLADIQVVLDTISDESKASAAGVALQAAFDEGENYNAVQASDDELKAATLNLQLAKVAFFNAESFAEITTKRIKELDTLALALGAEYKNYNGTVDATISEKIKSIASDDDNLAEIMKTAITAAIYSKIVAGQKVDSLDLTPFIKNYHLYATPILNETGAVTKDDGNTLKNTTIVTPGAQMQNIEHRWNSNKLWCIILDKEFINLYPGWTVKSDNNNGSGNRYVTVTDDTYGAFKDGSYGIIEGQLSMDWNSKAELKQTVTGLPVGKYSLSLGYLNNGGNGTSLKASSAGKEYSKKLSANENDATLSDMLIDNVMDIDFILTSGNNWSYADNFSLIYTSALEGYDYSTVLENAKLTLDKQLTIVDASEAVAANVEYFTISGVALSAPVKNQILLRKTTLSNREIVVEKVIIQ